MLIHNAVITGSLTLNGIDIGDITGSEASIGALNSFSASINTYTGSNDTTNNTQNSRLSALEITSGSLLTASGSFSTRVTNTETTASNLTIASASFSTRVANEEATGSSLVAASASFSTRVANTEATASSLTIASGSFSTRVTTNETNISNLQTASGSLSTRVTSAESSITSLQGVTGSYATTGSNNFVNTQYISATNNAVGFTSTASLYTDGGLRVTKDAFVSGTLYLNNLTVYGTQSISYITASQLNISTNIISVNTDTPAIRFGGLSVYDSGSTGLTGSILWDSQNNHWVYSNPSGSGYSGGMFISGPRSSTLGSEVGTTACALMMGQGGDHITSSAIFHYGNATCFYGNSRIESNGAACFGGNTTIAGNLGVGTVTPGQLIDVYKTSNDAVIRVTSCTAGAYIVADSCTDGYYGLVLQSNSNQRWFIGGYTTSDLTFKTSQTAGDEWLRINRTSGVACFASTICAPAFIGGTVSGTTGTFSGKLTVSQASTDFVAEFTNTSNSTPYGLRIKDAGTPANNYPLLSVTNNAGSTEYFRVNSGTGIATFSSTVCAPRLEVLRSSANNGLFVYSNSGATAIGCTMAQINGLTNDSTGNILTLASLNDGIRTVFRNDGYIGIGITNPDYRVHISTATKGIGTNEAGVVISSNESLAANIGGTLGFGATSDYGIVTLAKVGGYRENATGTSVSSYLSFETRAGGNAVTEKMRITSDGYVAVTGNQGLKCVPYLQGMSFGWNRTNGQGESMINWTNAGGGTACDLTFNFRNSTTLFERLRIASTGEATFNSTSYNVSNFNSTYGQSNINILNNGTAFAVFGSGVSVTATAGASDVGIGTAGLNNAIVFATGTSYLERMRITSGGNVSIGTTSAYTSRLNVQSSSPSVAAIKAGYGGVAGNGYTVLADNYTLTESLMSIGIDYSSGGLVLGSAMAPSTTNQGCFISTQAQFGGFGSAIRLSTSGEILFYRGTQDSVISTGNAKAATVSLFINNGGNVGIGTTDPLDKLMICGSDSGLYISNSSRSRLNLHTCGCGSWQIETNNTGGNQPGGALGITEAGVGSQFHMAKGGVACFKNTVCAPTFISSGRISSPHYFQVFEGSGNGIYYSSAIVQANSTQGFGANWVTLARVDNFSSANTRVMAKVTALMVSATSDQGNEHVGYGLINQAQTGYACPMTVSTGATLGNANVGTIKWCGTCLLYCAPAGSYFSSMIKTEMTAKDGASITMFCGSTNY